MQKYRFKFFLFVLTAATIYAACRKTDSQAEKPVSANQQSRFFDSHRSADPLEKALVSFFKNQNDKKGFVDKVIKQIGYPHWNKAITVNKPVQIGLESTDTTITYIPFVRDSQNYVNASLLLATTGGDTLMGYVCDWQYANMTFGGTQADSSAENMASFFMFFTKQTLGISKFKITDTALFASHPRLHSEDQLELTFLNPNPSGNLIETNTNQICYPSYFCGAPNSPECANGCDYLNCSNPPHCHATLICITFMGGDPGSGILLDPPGGGGSGGGGGGTGSGLPPGCIEGPVTPGTFFTDIDYTCGPGWVPVPIDPDEPPEPLNDSTMADNLRKAYLKAKSVADSLHSLAQINSKEYCFSYKIINNDTFVVNPKPGDFKSSQPTTGTNIIGVNHCHQDNGLSATQGGDRNQTFDGDDIFKFYSLGVLNGGREKIQFQTLTTRDFVYAAYITDIVKFKSHIVGLAGTTDFGLINDALYNIYDAILNASCTGTNCIYEIKSEAALAALTANNNSSVSGIRVFKSHRNNIIFLPL